MYVLWYMLLYSVTYKIVEDQVAAGEEVSDLMVDFISIIVKISIL